MARENNDVADDVRPRLVPKSRIGNNAHVSLARDIYDPFMYICGAQKVFPGNILRAQSQNVDSLLKNVSVSKDINGLYDYIARVASTCKQLHEEIDTEKRSHKEEIDSLKTHMQAIESRLLVLSPKNKDHKTTTTTGCKCRDKVSPQPQTERKNKAPKKNDKETNNDNELHVQRPLMPQYQQCRHRLITRQ